jgi:arabinofuranan 3-O-arabinosyltransferase
MSALGGEAAVDPLHPLLADSVESPCDDPLSRWVLAGLGAFFLLLAFFQSPGLIVDDTKLPVIMAPLAWMQSALHLWNQSLNSGSIQSETFGYLFPMAPFFEFMHFLDVPVWCAERIWLALLLTIGAWGVIRLAEALAIGNRWARVLGAVAYCVAPIVVDWAAISVDLLAVVFLPWVLQPLVVASRGGSTRRGAARSGVAVAFMGGVNATVILSVLPLALIWLFTRAPGPRRRSLVGWWLVCVVLACFWWTAATILQGKYGYNYLPYTETASITTRTGSVFEALRGTSYWQNYDDLGGPLVPGGWTLVSSGVAILATSLVTALGLVGLARRIPERLFLVASLCFGVVVIAIGYGGALGGPFSAQVISVLSGSLGPLRNVSKFSPDVALPLALGLTWVVSTVTIKNCRNRWFHRLNGRRLRLLIGSVAVLAVVFAAVPFWQQHLYPSGGFASIPNYWVQTAHWLDSHQGNQTALLVPGANFADYTWGKPQDEPLSVLASTSVTTRSIIPLGSDGNTEMLSAVEYALSTGTSEPGLAQYLSRSGIDFVVERNDLNLRATGAPPPAQVHQVLSETPGLVEVAAFGPYLSKAQVAQGDLPVYDSSSYLRLRPVEIYEVEPRVSEVRTFSGSNPLVVSGSSGSLLPLADTGVLNGRAAVLADDSHAGDAASRVDATWVITDGNQRREVAFGKIDDNLSYLLGPNQLLYHYPPLTYGSSGEIDAQTVAAPLGAASVSASSYGSTTLLPDPSEGPASAFDGDPSTAWVASGAGQSIGQWVSITFDRAIPLTRIAITPLDDSPKRPSLKRAIITTDSGSVLRSIPEGNSPVWVSVAPGLTRHLKITIDSVRSSIERSVPHLGVGITDVTIPGVRFRPAMQLPRDEESAFSGAARNSPIVSIDDPVTNPNLDFTGPISSGEPIARRILLPKTMSASISGLAVPVPGGSLERLLSQLATPPLQSLQISASSWIRALPRFRPENLLEKSAPPWVAGLGDKDPSVTLRWNGMRQVGAVSLGVTRLASRPTQVVITSPFGSRKVRVPRNGGLISFAPITTDTLTIHFVTVARRVSAIPTGPLTVGLPAPKPISLPVGLSSVGIPALGNELASTPAMTTPVDLPCGTGPTVRFDDTSVPTRIAGTLGNLIDLQPMSLLACSSPVTRLTEGSHTIFFPTGSPFRVTELLVQSPPSGMRPATDGAARSIRVMTWTSSRRTLEIATGRAAYVQIADNFNPGWVATLKGHTLVPVSLDGWEQGWIVPAGSAGTIIMTFAPDHTYRAVLLLGGLLLVALFILALASREPSRTPSIGPRRKLPGVVLAGAAAIIVFCVGGVLVVALIPMFAVARRWGSNVVAAIGGATFAAAGVIVAVHPVPVIAASGGAFGAPVQILAVAALCAVLSSVIVEERDPSFSLETFLLGPSKRNRSAEHGHHREAPESPADRSSANKSDTV